jgi:cyclohexa-1,5-dienecarbonyl-CoA hydratase
MTHFQTIKTCIEKEVAVLTLNHPPLNVMNIDMLKEINAGLAELKKSESAKVLLIKAEGKAFSAGVDIADHTADKVDEMMREFHRTFELLHGFKIPIVAAVDGTALGGGCELAIYCDMVIASERAKFGQPEIKVGVFPPVAAAMFPRLIRRNRTMELLMTGETISAIEAERIGLINRVLPVEGFEEQVQQFVAKLTAQSRIILQLTKRAIDRGLYLPCMEAIAKAEELYMGEMMQTDDAQEGLKAFMEKRAPVWINR